MAQLVKFTKRSALPIRQAIAITSSRPYADSHAVELKREDAYPKLGNRDIVGFGFNGYPTYIDRTDFPCPAVRFKENSADVVALREKEKGDWNKLSLQEKKALYRASFRQTYAEMKAPTGEWKSVLAIILMGISVSGWVMIWMRNFVYPPMPRTITKEWQHDEVRNIVIQRQEAVEGISSHFDYEKNEWKK